MLCAAVTFDGKLDTSDPLPPALLDFLAPAEGDVRLIDESWMHKTSPGWEQPVRILDFDCLENLTASRALGGHGFAFTVRRWLCLGGPKLFRALLDAGLVNDLCLLVRPRVDGRRGADTLSGPPTPEWFPRSISCRLRRMEVHGGGCLLHYTVGPRTARKPA